MLQQRELYLNNLNFSFRYSGVFEKIERNITGLVSEERGKVLLLWLALEYLGGKEAM